MSNNEDEQRLAQIRDTLPRMWWACYTGAIEAGFTNDQSFALAQTFIMSQNPYGNRPPTPVD